MKTNKVRVEQRPAAAALWELNGLAETERDERDKYHWIKPAQTRPNRINREWSRIDANDSGDRPVKPDQTKSNQIKPVRGKCLWHTELHGSEMGFGGVLGL
jgi:hypothetical protein